MATPRLADEIYESEWHKKNQSFIFIFTFTLITSNIVNSIGVKVSGIQRKQSLYYIIWNVSFKSSFFHSLPILGSSPNNVILIIALQQNGRQIFER